MHIRKEKIKCLIVRLKGGLGNQMFQYACAYTISKKYGYEIYIDKTFLIKPVKGNVVKRNFELDIFPNLDVKFANKGTFRSFFGTCWSFSPNVIEAVKNKFPLTYGRWIQEKGFHYTEFYETIFLDSILINGYWQSYKYFNLFDDEINKLFEIPISDSVYDLYTEIINSESVCINIRRNDFLVNPTHGVCSIDYYERAVQLLEQKVGIETKKFIFSDDLDWCKEHLKFENIFFVEHTYKGDRFSQYLALMRSCKYFIIANSSFAWWAAYLSRNKSKIVIAPKRWFADSSHKTADIYLPDWLIV